MMTEERTPRTDAIALRLVGKSGLFCDPESLEQYNDLVVVARQLERELAEALEERDAAFAMSRCECGTDEACANLARLHAELAEARKALINACDAARNFPANTCPASRHVQQMAEELLSGGYPMLAEEPGHCAESMLATVRALWEARKDAERLNELQRRYIGADFMYGEDERTVLLIDWSGRSVTKDLRVAIDAAITDKTRNIVQNG